MWEPGGVEGAGRGKGRERLKVPVGAFAGEPEIGEGNMDEVRVRRCERVPVEFARRPAVLDIDVDLVQVC